ncbi:Ca(2+)-dependent cysteine protease [Tulasnella sp. 403]|nr:Ca(2+)-dependent cysteine protease [Tulasnella sp. 403]
MQWNGQHGNSGYFPSSGGTGSGGDFSLNLGGLFPRMNTGFTPPAGGGPPSLPSRPESSYPPPSNYPDTQTWRGHEGPGSNSIYNTQYGGPGGSNFSPPPGPPPQHHYGPPAGPPPQQGYASPQGPPPFPIQAPGRPYMPPTQTQYIGSQTNTPGGGEQDRAFFKWSSCTGRKKALIIGINYIGTDGALGGCINDAHKMKAFIMRHFAYKDEDVVMLTDDSRVPAQMPNKANILRAMQWLVRNAQENDSLFFHYSGHGGLTKDLDGDEEDGYDEVIYPVDFKTAGHIVDDDMHDIMYSTEGKIKEPNVALQAGSSLLGAGMAYMRKDYKGVFKGVKGVISAASGGGSKADQLSRRTKSSPADVISWSGCKDSQTSADTQVAGEGTGAMSWAFTESLNQNPQQSYQQLLVDIRQRLRAKYEQKPQLSSSHPIDTNILFIA